MCYNVETIFTMPLAVSLVIIDVSVEKNDSFQRIRFEACKFSFKRYNILFYPVPHMCGTFLKVYILEVYCSVIKLLTV